MLVGPSNSGKSAVLRALKAVARNVSSPAAVRVGAKMFTVTLDDPHVAVSVERGKSHSAFRVVTERDEKAYTKTGRTVPEEVQQVLGLPDPEGPDVVFSSQIDPPFLLAETGSTAAKMLGDLTNVSKLHAAAREANRRRQEASRMLKVRQNDAVEAMERLQGIAPGLRERGQRLAEARREFDKVKTRAERRSAAAGVLSRLGALLEQRATLYVPPEPAAFDLTEVEALIERRDQVEVHAGKLAAHRRDQREALAKRQMCVEKISALAAEYEAVLREAGQCPVCGADTRERVA